MKANVQQIDAMPESSTLHEGRVHTETGGRSMSLALAASLTLVLGIVDALLHLYLAGGGASDLSPATATLVNQSALQSASIRWLLTAVAVVIAVTLGNVRMLGPVRLAPVLYGIIIGYIGLIFYALGLILLG